MIEAKNEQTSISGTISEILNDYQEVTITIKDALIKHGWREREVDQIIKKVVQKSLDNWNKEE